MYPSRREGDVATRLRLLVIDDSPEDAALIVRHLGRQGFEVEHTRVDSADGLTAALQESAWDAAVCDYSMPGFDPARALVVLRGLGIDIPVIVVSGMVGEEAAVACMRAGAHDFVLKDNLTRLAPAVRRELVDAATRRRLRASESALAQSMKLRALGQMAAGIAHDLKNILHPLALQLHIAARALEKKQLDGAAEAIEAAREVTRRGVETVDRLRDYGRLQQDERAELVDLDRLVNEAIGLAKSRMTSVGHMCHVRDELTQPPPVLGHASDILSAIVNLIVNAIDATPQDGTITLRSGATDDGDSWVEVADDGPGMSPEVEQHVFEPFFTTKGEQGLGLGLPMVYACMQRHGGDVTLVTAPNQGATFRLLFRGQDRRT